jgi:hypothetical protein
MAQVGSTTSRKVVSLLQSQTGLPFSLSTLQAAAGLDLGPLTEGQIVALNIAPELAEKHNAIRYPMFCVRCDKVTNELTEKFRVFSGTAHLSVEVRHSQDRLEHLDEILHSCVEAVTQVLDSNRGDWGAGMFFGGSYEVVYTAIRRGGKNYLQSARVSFPVKVSTSA